MTDNNNMTPACRGILGFQNKLPRDVAITIECIAHKHRCKAQERLDDIKAIEELKLLLECLHLGYLTPAFDCGELLFRRDRLR